MSGLKFPKEETKKKRMSHPASILGSRKGRCYLCSRYGQTEEHHIFGGPNRTLSEKYGLKVYLCISCHRTGSKAVHDSMNGSENRQILHEDAQKAFEAHWGTRGYFMEIFGRNYLDEGER